MQRSITLNPWDKAMPLKVSDRLRDSDQQLVPKCPLPIMRSPTRKMRSLRQVGIAGATDHDTNNKLMVPYQQQGTLGKIFPTSTRSTSTTNRRSPSPQMNKKTTIAPDPTTTTTTTTSRPSSKSSPSIMNQQTTSSLLPPLGGKGSYPDLNIITAQQFNSAKAMADAHRRQRTKRWQQPQQQQVTTSKDCCTSSNSCGSKKSEESGKAEVTSPISSAERKVIHDVGGSLPSSRDLSIPHHIKVNKDALPRRVSDLSAFTDDSPTQQKWPEEVGVGSYLPESSLPKSKEQRDMDSSCLMSPPPLSPVPSALDKTSVKKLAVQHRRSFCAPLTRTPTDTGATSTTGSRRRSSGSSSSCNTSSPRSSYVGRDSESGRDSGRRPSSSVLMTSSPQQGSSRQQQSQSALEKDIRYQRPTSSYHTPAATTMVEIFPGLSAPLRGSDETRNAVANNYYTHVFCFGCCSQIYCIADVQYTICPLCRTISPVEDEDDPSESDPTHHNLNSRRWGLGLGFTEESLWDMQAELAAKRFGFY